MTEVDVGAFLVPVFLLFLVNSLLCWIALPHSQILRAVSLIFFAKSLLLWPVCAGANDAMSDKYVQSNFKNTNSYRTLLCTLKSVKRLLDRFVKQEKKSC